MSTSSSSAVSTYAQAVSLARKAINRAYAPCGGQSGPVADHIFPGLGEAWVCTTPTTFGWPRREDCLAVLVRVAAD